MNLDDMPSCPACGSYEVRPTTRPDEKNECEYRCVDCGEYFVDKAPPPDGAEAAEEETSR